MFMQPLQQSLDSRRRGSRGHLFVVGSLDKHIQNEKELIRPRRFLPARRELSAPGAEGTKGGLFFICVESANLT